MLWLVSLALMVAGTVGVVLGAVLLAIPLAILGFILYAAGSPALTVIYGVACGILAFGGLLVLGAAVSAYWWHYWTLGFLRLTERTRPS
jgi:hypothetical protein